MALLIVASMLFTLIACVNGGPNTPGTSENNTTSPGTNAPDTSAEPQTSEPETTVNPHADPHLPEVNYNGETFSILGNSEMSPSTYGAQRDLVFLEDVTTNSINEAVRDRNDYVMDTYGVTIKGVLIADDIGERLESAERGNLAISNIFVTSLMAFGKLIDNGRTKDLKHEVSSYLDLTESFWNQKLQKSMSIANRLYFISGDFLTSDKESTWTVSFNRDMITELGLENPYNLVDNETWTYDAMYSYMQTASDYADHDPSDQFNIRWGCTSEASNNYYLWQASNFTLIDKTEQDYPILGELTEDAFDAMQKVARQQYDKTVTLMANDVKGVANVYFEGTIKIFMDGNSLFFIGSTSILEWMRDKDTDFGILPLPKFNNEQRGYCSSQSPAHSCQIGIQYSFGLNQDGSYDQNLLDMTAIITQALCCESTATVLEAYYDKTLVYKGLRREEDERMLDLVFQNRVYDLTLVFSWADALTQAIGGARNNTAVTRLKQSFDRYENSINKAINTFLEKHGMI